MLDLRWIRDDPEAFDRAMARRGLAAQSPAILELDTRRRALQTRLQELQAERNTASKQIGAAKQQGMESGANIMAVMAGLKEQLAVAEANERDLGAELDTVLAALPNVFDDAVPDGRDDADNLEIRRVGTPRAIENPQDHATLGEKIGLMDFEGAARLSGARFTVVKKSLARMERAIGQFMLDLATVENGYTEYSVPLLVRDEALFGTGQLPKFAEDLFRTTDDRWLIPTSEVPLTNLVAGQIIDADLLPLRLTALTPCFRSEAGSAGKDTRGMIRQHQFWKVEMVSITRPEESDAELERMTGCAESVLKRLDLPFRTVLKCAGDTGFSARKSYDVEVWIPAQNTYREISSCSNCGDFQARRMKARFRGKGEKDTRFVHTLNGSGVAVGRALVAVMENYQNPDGSIAVPDALAPYMGGVTKIDANA
jgi:seryl-tRNA synthetase